MMRRRVTIDGLQLVYPRTGLGLATLELLRAWCESGAGSSIRVLVPDSFDEAPCRQMGLDCAFVRIGFQNHWGYSLGRFVWGLHAARWLRRHGGGEPHLIPYFLNYGALRRNTVIVPDLHWRIAPDSDARDQLYKWWSGKGAWRPVAHWIEEKLVRRARRIVVHSRFVSAETQRLLAVPAARIAFVPLAPPHWVTESHDPSGDRRVAEKLGLPERFVLYFSRYEPRKNVGMLLEACGEVHRRDTSFRCVFVGLDQPETLARFEVRQALADPSVRQSVVGLPGVDQATLASLLRLAEFCVYPSLSEGFGLPLLEAAAAGRLCLCADNSSLRELQKDARLRVPTTDRGAWVERIGFYWRNADEARTVGQEAAGLAQAYSWQRSATELWDLLHTEAGA